MRTLLLASATLLASACSPHVVSVDRAWIRLPAVAGQPGAAYFTVHGADISDEVLVGLSTPAAAKADMHESMTGDHGVMSMAPLRDVTIPRKGDVAFAPGGKHVMLYGLKPGLKAGNTVSITLRFVGGGTATTDAKLVAAGDSAPL